MIIMNMDQKIELVNRSENKKKLKKLYKIGEGLTQVKVIGIGPKAIKILVYEASRFTVGPVWKQHWVKYHKDIEEKEYAQLLFKAMVDTIT